MPLWIATFIQLQENIMLMQDYKSRRRGLLQRMRWALQAKIDARVEARALRRSQLVYVRLPLSL